MYHYQTLEHADSIRLLYLLPGAPCVPLCCELRHVRKADNPCFEALSYAWGSLDLTHVVHVNHGAAIPTQIPITKNLSEALVALRSENSTRCLWVDAICINQKDTPEKNHQVIHMSDIYRMAERVVVWLGPAGQDCELDIVQELAAHSDYLSQQSDAPLPANLLQILENENTYTFFRRPWWTRVWVVQEFILARTVQMQLGSREVDMDTIRKISHLCFYLTSFHSRSRCTSPALLLNLHENVTPLGNLLAARYYYLSRSEIRYGLFDYFLNLSWNRFCSNSRDHVYALLGLAHNTIVVNYDLSETEVFDEFITSCLVCGEIIVLYYCEDEWLSHGGDWPSWRPSITGTPGYNPADSRLCTPIFGRGLMERRPVFKVTISVRDPCSVVVRGVVLGGVTERLGVTRSVNGTMELREDDNAEAVVFGGFKDLIEVQQAFQHCLRWRVNHCHAQTLASCLPKVVLDAGLEREALQLQCLPPYAGEPYYMAFLNTISVGKGHILRACLNENTCQPATKKRSLEVSEEDMRARKIFTTEQGYLGLGPQSLQRGDQVVMFDGADVPFVLRKHGDDWKILGQCYLHGWMDGNYFGHAIIDPFSHNSANAYENTNSCQDSREDIEPTSQYAYVPPGHDGIKVLVKQDFVIC